MPKAFVSYSREDELFVNKHVKPILRALHVDIWIDTADLHGAEDWKATIERGLRECDYFLVIVTPAAAASPAVRQEVDWILQNREHRLIPILAESVRLDGIHSKMPDIHHVDCLGKSPGQSATSVARALFQLANSRSKGFEERSKQLNETLEQKHEELVDVEEQLATLNKQLDQILNFDGDWRQPPLGDVAPFVPRDERNATIISIMNVKGGVGKSTIAANLAATWWGRAEDPKRVLVVDLDFQQSVTSLCLNAEDRADLLPGNLYVNSLFDEKVPAAEHFSRCIRRIGGAKGYVLASNDELTRVETQMMARWLAGQTKKDVRFLFRELLHGPAIQERFDLVIIDCPPRIHTASINALAASDFLLVPVLLDLTSADSVPRLLKWVRTYQKKGVCPNIEILGVIANKKSNRSKTLLARENNIWNELPGKCRIAWGGEVPFCKTVIPNTSVIANCAQTPGKFACQDSAIRPTFNKLVEELEQQMQSSMEIPT